jgi:uroporphyrin-III C-methyltransferase
MYMALKHLDAICRRLVACGRGPSEPMALVSKASTTEQRVIETTVAAAAADAQAAGLEPPAIVVLGEVVRLRAALDWLGALEGRVPEADPLGTRGRSEAV